MTKEKDVLTENEDRILLLKTNDGELQITIPFDAKVTFGPSVPFVRKTPSYEQRVNDYSLRIYKGTKENLIAVFSGVYSFRDITIPVKKLIIREAGTSVWKSDEDGFEVNQKVDRKKDWTDDLLQLGTGNSEPE